MIEQHSSLFGKYAKNFLPIDAKKNYTLSLKECSHVSLIIDTLSRQQRHHALLLNNASDKIQNAILASVAERLQINPIPKTLRNAYFIYFDVTQFALGAEKPDVIAQDFIELRAELHAKNKRIILALNQIEPLLNNDPNTSIGYLGNLLKSILSDDRWRLIIFSPTFAPSSEKFIYEDFFTEINLTEPTKTEALALLASFRRELESFHHVIIPEETCVSAISMVGHYLSATSRLDKALDLLDSAAARLSSQSLNDLAGHHPVVTSIHLAQVVSSWTQIPLSHLQNNKFQATKFVESLKNTIIGQELALQTIGSILQNACIKLVKKSGPLASLLLAGPPGTGKVTLAYAMAEHLFGHKNSLLRVNFNHKIPRTLADIQVVLTGNDERCMHLLTAVQQTPYAILLIENIELLSAEVMNIFKEILQYGYAFDETKKKYDFRNIIILMTANLASERLSGLNNVAQEKHKPVDLMQLVLNEHVHENSSDPEQHWSAQEVRDEMIAALTTRLSTEWLHYFNIIPFSSLDYVSIEQIIRLKLKLLVKQLDLSFGIELNYAPEIIKFLAHEALWQRGTDKSLDKFLEQQLYSCITHEILAHIDDKNKAKRLLVQLNDNGQLLRCEFMFSNEAGLYQI